MIRGTADITDPRLNGLFTFPLKTTEKLETETSFREEVGP